MPRGHSLWNRVVVKTEVRVRIAKSSFSALSFNKFSIILVCTASLSVIFFKTSDRDAQVAWPVGWKSSVLPSPIDAQGKPIGSRQRAILHDKDGKQVAAMEITRITALNEYAVNIENVIVTMRKALKQHYAGLGLLATCSRPTSTQVGDLSGLQTTCHMMASGKKVLKHTLVTAAGGQVTYSLEYAADPAIFSDHLDDFSVLLRSLKSG
nr:DUF4946 domain-containing protein [Pseudomonas putida]